MELAMQELWRFAGNCLMKISTTGSQFAVMGGAQLKQQPPARNLESAQLLHVRSLRACTSVFLAAVCQQKIQKLPSFFFLNSPPSSYYWKRRKFHRLDDWLQ